MPSSALLRSVIKLCKLGRFFFANLDSLGLWPRVEARFLRFLGPTSCKLKFSWPLAKSGSPLSEVVWDQNLGNLNFLGLWPRVDACFLRFLGTKSNKLKFSWPLVKSGGLFPKFSLDQHLHLYLFPCWNNKGATFWVGSVAQEAFMGERQGQFWAQDAHISSLASQFWTFFADQPTGQDSRPVFCGIGVQKCVIYVSPR